MFAERVCDWNRRYESVPEERRFHYVLWSLMALFTVNMMLTVKAGFPFGLLVLFGFLVLANGRTESQIKSAHSTPAELGKKDATAAAASAQREGFPPHTLIFLDQEEGGRLTAEQSGYLFAGPRP